MAAKHLYLRDYTKTNKHPIGCLAVETDKAANEIRYAISACSPLDKFNAKVARDKAFGRFKQAPVVIHTQVPDTGHEITKLVMQHIIATNTEQGHAVSRSHLALKAAEGWLEYAATNYPDTKNGG